MKTLMLGLAPLLLTIAAPAFAAPAFAANAAQWKVSEVSGNVKVIEAGHSRAAVRGALLASGATIVAAANGRAILVHAKDAVILSPGSRIRLASAEQQQKSLFQVIAEFGTSMFRIEHQANPHFGVQTPYLAAVVKGTVFTVNVGAKGASVQVTQGAVDVATLDGGAHELIRPGMIGSVRAGDKLRLDVDGSTHRTIRSNGAVASVPAGSSATVNAAAAPNQAPGADDDDIAPGEAPAAQVSAPVQAAPVSLADVTNGLVQGSANPAIVLASVSKPAVEHDRSDSASSGSAGGGNGSSGKGDSGGNGTGVGSSGNGSGANGNAGSSDSGNGSSGGNGSGNANSGGNGNGNSSGSGSANSGGSGNASSGDGGNGNSGGNGNGNSGNGNSNSSGGSATSGGGNTGSDDNGKGNAGGNNDGNSGGSDDGKTGGNGNSNAGNGNGNDPAGPDPKNPKNPPAPPSPPTPPSPPAPKDPPAPPTPPAPPAPPPPPAKPDPKPDPKKGLIGAISGAIPPPPAPPPGKPGKP